MQKNDLAQALAEYQKAITINPGLSQAHFGLAVVYLQQGQNDQALEELQKFQANDDGTDKLATAQANIYLGAIYLDKGDTEKALVEYQKALQIDPKLGRRPLWRGPDAMRSWARRTRPSRPSSSSSSTTTAPTRR